MPNFIKLRYWVVFPSKSLSGKDRSGRELQCLHVLSYSNFQFQSSKSNPRATLHNAHHEWEVYHRRAQYFQSSMKNFYGIRFHIILQRCAFHLDIAKIAVGDREIPGVPK